MHQAERRVVVTGLGTINPLSDTIDGTWKALVDGRSGIGPITQFDTTDLKTKIAGEVSNFDSEVFMPLREARRMDRFSQLFVGASQLAMDHSGLDMIDEDDPEVGRAGVMAGVGFGGMVSFIGQLDVLRDRGPSRVSPLTIPMIIPNEAAGLASMRFNMQGPVSCVVTACAASAHAIGDAAEIIKRGTADVMLAGGAEAANCGFSMAAFNQAKALSTRNEDPAAASRPFDRDRDGFVMSEGAAVLVLEERARAVGRGATIHGELIGYGMSSDAYHVTLPRPGGIGAARAMTNAMQDAGIGPSQIDYINAHGTSTSANDATETAAIKLALGDAAKSAVISSTKSMTGHLLGAAGALESLVCLQAIANDVVPPTINLDNPDPECDLDYVPNEARELDVKYAMTNSFGFGGHNVSLIFASGG